MAYVRPDCSTIVARIVGRSSAMDAGARTVAAKAAAIAGQYRDTGAYIASIEVSTTPGKQGVLDRLISATDPAAQAIEYGHVAPDGSWVEGLHIMERAAGE